ncbi:MAG: poly-gamma-glutamate hydrolase family protein [Deltaproteobacteria bacterium]|nr:poly-gamma-glutamate hydrolase family protein [Deltaproteobacteria bacterium]
MDTYSSYEELAQHETEGVDYVIVTRNGPSPIAVIAPHGGGIEPGTADIADAVAADQHAFSAFKGIKKAGNADLHIRSDRFDEPVALRTAAQAVMVVTIHGCRGDGEQVYVGGRNEDVKMHLLHALNRAGFRAQESLKPGLRGRSPRNICNRCRTGLGVQIEISKGLRTKMFETISKRSLRKKTDTFYRFVRVIRNVLDENQPLNGYPVDADKKNSVKGIEK